jgi:hypothetical protein
LLAQPVDNRGSVGVALLGELRGLSGDADELLAQLERLLEAVLLGGTLRHQGCVILD